MFWDAGEDSELVICRDVAWRGAREGFGSELGPSHCGEMPHHPVCRIGVRANGCVHLGTRTGGGENRRPLGRSTGVGHATQGCYRRIHTWSDEHAVW